MTISPRSVALQGFGFGQRHVAMQGFVPVSPRVFIGGGGRTKRVVFDRLQLQQMDEDETMLLLAASIALYGFG